jgi:hypothetical protein
VVGLGKSFKHILDIYGIFWGWDSTSSCGFFKQSIGAGNRVGIGLSYQPVRLHSLAELIPWNRLLGSLKVHKNENFFGFDFEICTFS